MKKLVVSLFALLFCTNGIAHATSFQFSDMIDYWNLDGTSYGEQQTIDHYFDSLSFTECRTLLYTHNINDSVDFQAGEIVSFASLELDFTNDLYDGSIYIPTGFFSGYWSDQTENISYSFDGSGWTLLGEVDNGQYTLGLDLSLINVDGILNVELAVSNFDTGNTIAFLDHSLLSGTAESAPVPEPGTLFLLGSGLAGLAGYRRRKSNR